MGILPGSRTIARFPGRCACCGEDIRPDDLIEYSTTPPAPADGGWVLVTHRADATLTLDRAPCPRCFTVPAASGACLCED